MHRSNLVRERPRLYYFKIQVLIWYYRVYPLACLATPSQHNNNNNQQQVLLRARCKIIIRILVILTHLAANTCQTLNPKKRVVVSLVHLALLLQDLRVQAAAVAATHTLLLLVTLLLIQCLWSLPNAVRCYHMILG